MVLDRSEFALRTRRQNAHGWAGNKSVASFGTKLVLRRCNKEVHRQRSTRMYNCLTVYFKRLTANGISGRIGMSVVPRSNKFACKLAAQKCARMYIFGRGCPWFHSEATFCAMHKSRRQNAQGWAGNKSETSFGTKLVLYRCTWTYIGREVHECTLLDRLFQKAYGKCVFKSGSGVRIYFVLHKKDRYGIYLS